MIFQPEVKDPNQKAGKKGTSISTLPVCKVDDIARRINWHRPPYVPVGLDGKPTEGAC